MLQMHLLPKLQPLLLRHSLGAPDEGTDTSGDTGRYRPRNYFFLNCINFLADIGGEFNCLCGHGGRCKNIYSCHTGKCSADHFHDFRFWFPVSLIDCISW